MSSELVSSSLSSRTFRPGTITWTLMFDDIFSIYLVLTVRSLSVLVCVSESLDVICLVKSVLRSVTVPVL